VLPNWSWAVTVNVPAVPATTGDGKPATAKWMIGATTWAVSVAIASGALSWRIVTVMVGPPVWA
jgi:hypothetical protein